MSSIPMPSRRPAHPWRSEIRACLALGTPLVVTNAVEMGVNLVTTALVGRMAPGGLGAVTLAIAFYYVTLTFGIGLTAAVSPMIAVEVGRGRETDAAVRRVVSGGIWTVAAVFVPVWVLFRFAEPILLALGQDPGLSRTAAAYLQVLQWALLPTLAYLVLRSMLAALERPRWAVVTGIASVVVSAVLTALLIGGGGPVPGLGVIGAAWATVGAQMFMVVALAAAILRDRRLGAIRPFSDLAQPPWHAIGSLLRLGLPIGVSIMLEAGMFTAAAGLIGHVDAPSLAAHAIALQVASLAFMVPLGIAQAATVRVGRAAGAGDRAAVGRAGWTALGLGTGLMACSGLVLVGCGRQIVDLFLAADTPAMAGAARTAVMLLAVAALFQIADGAQVVLSGILRGLQDTRVPMLIAGAGYWGIGVPVAAFLAPRAGAVGVWLGLVTGLCAVAGLLLARWLSWRRA